MISRALKLIRQFHKVKQVDLAEKLQISKSYLSEIESGKKTVSYNLIEKYAQEFDISPSSLVFLSESLSKKEPKRISDKFSKAFSTKIVQIMEWLIEKEAAKIKN